MKYAVILLLLVFSSCNSDKDKILTTREDGLLYQEGSTVPFTGIEKGFVENKYIEYEVINGEKHGYFKVSDSKGNVETLGHISHNKYEGKWEYFYPDGKIESVGNFSSHMPSGEWKWFYPNGKLKEAGTYVEGEREGEWKTYSENGELQSVKNFANGQIVEESANKENI